MRLNRFGGFFVGLVVCFLLGICCGPAFGAKGVPAGATIVEFDMDVPESAEAREYLGLKEGKTFTLSQISGKLVLIEFYSMY